MDGQLDSLIKRLKLAIEKAAIYWNKLDDLYNIAIRSTSRTPRLVFAHTINQRRINRSHITSEGKQDKLIEVTVNS